MAQFVDDLVPSNSRAGEAPVATSPLGRSPARSRTVSHRVVRDLAGASTLAVVVAIFGNSQSSRLRLGLLAFVLSLLGSMLAHRRLVAAALLPLMRTMFDVVGPMLGLVALQAMLLLGGYEAVAVSAVPVAPLAVCLVVLTTRKTLDRATPKRVRVLVIGSGMTADRVVAKLQRHKLGQFVVAGWLGPAPEAAALASRSRRLGGLEVLTAAVQYHQIDMVLMDDDLSPSEIFDELAAAHVDWHLDVVDWTAFSERVFGHVPLSSLRTAWFRFVLDPSFRSPSSRAKRALDLSVALSVAAISAPLLAALALMVRRDGGPALFRQVRVGEDGQTFELYKLRSMRVEANAEERWSQQDDDRVTGIGRLLRRTHLDELPQLLNVIKGDMSLVGPRPEQPALAAGLEQTLPYYARRHSVRPGITGWAQVRCGYGGSDAGSAWKLSHDLYYLKHRSLALDLLILSETFRTLVADHQYRLDPSEVAELLGAE